MYTGKSIKLSDVNLGFHDLFVYFLEKEQLLNPNTIGGYPINIISASNFDALMFVDDEWTNIPQTEITDGGNF